MKTQSTLSVHGEEIAKESAFPRAIVYPLFLVHMLGFGLTGFLMAYWIDPPAIGFMYLHGGIAILVYLIFYLAIFGVDEVKWMFINSALGLMGIYAQIDWILAAFGKQASNFSAVVHAIPFLYYVLYTFLLHQLVLDLTGARGHPVRERWVDALYVVGSVLIYGSIYRAA